MENLEKTEIKTNRQKDFIGIHPLFDSTEITELLTHHQVSIEFNTQTLPLRLELPELKEDQIFSYTQEDGQVLDIQITKLELDSESDIDKRIFKGKATFKIIE